MSSTTSSIEEEGLECPICQAHIKPFYLDYETVLFMCEKKSCCFPYSEKSLDDFTCKTTQVKKQMEVVRKRIEAIS